MAGEWVTAGLSLFGNRPFQMFSRIEGRTFILEEKQVRNQVGPHLIVNRAEVISEGCQACGNGFASGPAGERRLTPIVGPDKNAYMFCAACGNPIMGQGR